VDVYAYWAYPGEPWELIDHRTCVDCPTSYPGRMLNFTKSYSCPLTIAGTEYTPPITLQYMFNASDETDRINQTAVYYFDIDRDDIEAINVTPIANAVVNRTATTIFIALINDTDANMPVANQSEFVKIYISKYNDPSSWDTPLYSSTNASGYANRSMTHSQWCSDEGYAPGQEYWKIHVPESPCWKETTSVAIPFWLKGELNNTLILPDGSKNFSRQDVGDSSNYIITFKGSVKDDCGNTKASLSSYPVYFIVENGNYKIELYADTLVDGGVVYQTQWNPPVDAPLGWYNVTMISYSNASEADKYWNGSAKLVNAFFLASIPYFENTSINPVSGSWEIRPFNFSTYVTNIDNTTTNITLWLRNESIWLFENRTTCTNCKAYHYFYQRNFSCSDIGIWYARFTANSTSSFSNETVVSFEVTKVNVHFNYVAGNRSILNRNDSKINNTALLSVQIWDDDINNYTTALSNATEVFAFATTDGSSYVELDELVNETHYFVYFNPDCSYSAGKQHWKFNTTSNCYKDASTEEFSLTVYADLDPDLIKPDGSVNYSKGDTIEFYGTVSDDCLQPVSNARVRFIIKSTAGTYYCPNATGWITNTTNEYYCYWNSSEAASGGWFNVSMLVEKDYHHAGYDNLTNAFFLTTPVVLENPKHVAEQDGGWGEEHNFSVNVTHYAPVYVCLLEKLTATSNYTVTECKYVSNPDGSAVVFSRSYSCSDYQAGVLKYFKFNASQPDVPATYAESAEGSHILAKDDIVIEHWYGNNEQVNRSYGSISLILHVKDLDSNSDAYVPDYNSPLLRFNIYNGSAYLLDGSNSSNATGHVIYNFAPGCSYDVGLQSWYAETFGDSCFKDVQSSTFNLTILGFLVPNITYPNGETFIRYAELYIPINGTVRDECNLHNISLANVSFAVQSIAFGTYYSCEPVQNQSNGIYNCTFNATNAEQGWYNIYMNASNTTLTAYYNDGKTDKTYAFRVVQSWVPPELKDETVTASDDFGWGESFVFKVNVSDLNAEDVNVSFFISSDNVSWQLIDWQMCYDCGEWHELSFSYSGYTCSDKGVQYFKFNATDAHNSTSGKSVNFTLIEDDVEVLLVAGNNSAVSRNSNQYALLRVRLNDTDKAELVTIADINISFWVTLDGNSFDSGFINRTDSNGIASYYFMPDCSYAAMPQLWKAGSINNYCYKSVNSTLYNVLVKGWLLYNLTKPNGEVYHSNENVTIEANVSDECMLAITDASVSFNVTHASFEDECKPVSNYSNAIYNCTWNISNNPSGWYDVKVLIKKNYYNDNLSIEDNRFFHQVSPVLSGEYVEPVVAPWGTTEFPRTFSVNVTDDDDTVTVYLWHRKWNESANDWGSWQLADSKTCNDCINTTLVFVSSDFGKYAAADIGDWQWKFNATDLHDGFANTSVHYLNVTKRNVTFSYYAGNETNVSRIGTNTTKLSLIVKDAVSGSTLTGVSGNYWITTNGNDWKVIDAGSITSGFLNLSFDPDCDFLVGRQYWKGEFEGSALYYAANSTVNASLNGLVLYVWSKLNISHGILYPRNAVPILRGSTVDIKGQVRELDCPRLVSDPSTVVKFTVRQGAFADTLLATNEGDGNYSAGWNSFGANLGLYDIEMNASSNYYNGSVSYTEHDAFRLGEAPELANPHVDNEQDGWGYNYTFTVEFRDLDTESPGNAANISLYYAYSKDGPWYEIDTVEKASSAFIEVNFSKIFSCNDYLNGPTIYYKFNATDGWGFTDETEIKNLTLEKDDVGFIFVDGVGIDVDREGNVYGLFAVKVNDTDYGQLVGSGVSVKFYFTYDGISYDAGHLNSTTNGYVSYLFDPDCSYSTGSQFWYAATTGNACYKDTNSISQPFAIIGQLKNYLIEPTNWTIYNVTDLVNITFNVSSDCANEDGIESLSNKEVWLIHNKTATAYSCTPIDYAGSGIYNCTFNSVDKPEGNYSIRIVTNKTSYHGNDTTWLNMIWLENRPPSYANLTVSPELGGWGDTYNFSIYLDDPEQDNLICKLFVNTTRLIYAGSSSIAGKGNCWVTTSFDCMDISNATFWFEIVDEEPANTFNTSIAYGPKIRKDRIAITYVAGDGVSIGRYGSTSKQFVVYVEDLNRSQPAANANGSFWITKDGISFDKYEYNQTGQRIKTNASGYLVYELDPDCSFTTGMQYWQAGIEDYCYYALNATASNYTYYVNGSLFFNQVEPAGLKVLRGNNVTISVNITDDCNAIISDASVSFEMKSLKTLQDFSCSPVLNHSNGIYNCTFNTSANPGVMPPKGYNLTITASKKSYYTLSKTYENDAAQDVAGTKSFWIETAPFLEGPQSIPEVGGWGETFTFKVNVTDYDEDQVRVYCWYRKKTETSWLSCGSAVRSGINSTASFTKTWGPADISDYDLKFNVSEVYVPTTADEQTDETVPINFTVEKDDIAVEYVDGNESVVHRISNSTVLKVRIKDTDKNEYIASGYSVALWVTTDWDNFRLDTTTTSLSGGYANITFNPDCNYETGKQRWIIGLLDNSYYKTTNSSAYNVTIVSDMYVTIVRPINESFLRDEEGVILRANVSDECSAVKGYGLFDSSRLDVTTEFYIPNKNYYCTAINDEGNGYYNCTIPQSTVGLWDYGWYDFRFNASAICTYPTTVDCYTPALQLLNDSFYLASRPTISGPGTETNPTVNPTSAPWAQTFEFNSTINNPDGNKVYIYYWKRKTSETGWELIGTDSCEPCNNYESGILKKFACKDIGTNEFKVNVTSVCNTADGCNYNNSKNGASTFVVEENAVLLEIVYIDSNVSREGTDYAMFKVRVKDTSNNSYVPAGVNGSLFVSTDQANTTFSEAVRNQTDSDGYLIFYFNPNCSYFAGWHRWYGGVWNDKCYVDITTNNKTLTIIGQLKNILLEPYYLQKFGTKNIINISFNITDECNNFIAGADSKSVELKSPSNEWETCIPVYDEGNGRYNCSWDSTLKELGLWSLSLIHI